MGKGRGDTEKDELLFGSDRPYDVGDGAFSIRQTLEAIEGMDMPESNKKKNYEGYARNLLHL